MNQATLYESWELRVLIVTVTLKYVYSFSVSSEAIQFVYYPGLRERGFGPNPLFWLIELFVHDQRSKRRKIT